MSSSLTFQLRQHQQKEEQKHSSSVAGNNGVGTTVAAAAARPSTVTSLPSPPSSSYGDESSSVSVGEKDRRDSLPTHFNALTLQNFSISLPENYTIEHSASPIPIVPSPSSPRCRHKHHHNHYRAELSSPTATAAATGGLTIRGNNARIFASSLPSCPSSSPSYSTTTVVALQNNSVKQKLSISATTTKALHRCEDCGKVYKHPNCLAKHRWEHSDEWELTSKLLLTKHQQVQMLEAAAILVSLDTKRVEQQQRMLEQRRDHPIGTDTEDEEDDNDDESIHIEDDDDIIVDMEMDEDPAPVISIASSSTTSPPSLLPDSFPNSDD